MQPGPGRRPLFVLRKGLCDSYTLWLSGVADGLPPTDDRHGYYASGHGGCPCAIHKRFLGGKSDNVSGECVIIENPGWERGFGAATHLPGAVWFVRSRPVRPTGNLALTPPRLMPSMTGQWMAMPGTAHNNAAF